MKPERPTLRDVGRMGEHQFELWCGAVGIVANKSKTDMTGWDYLVEFPVEHTSERPVDLTPSPLECRVQVKSSDRTRKRVSISLRNAERLAKTSMPTFICALEFDGMESPQRAYLIHIGEELIRRTLKRLRALGATPRTHVRYPSLSLSYGDSQRLRTATGESLKEAIRAHVPDGSERYQQWKRNLLATLGYEDGPGYITVQIAGNDPLGDLSDLSLGLRESMQVESVAEYDSRFGIDCLIRQCGEGATLSLGPATLAGSVRFRARKSLPWTEFSAKIHNPSMNRVVPCERIRFRLETEFFEILLEPFKGMAKFKFLPGVDQKRVSLVALKDFLKLRCLLGGQLSKRVLMDVTVGGQPFLPEASLACGDLRVPKTELEMVQEALQLATVYDIDREISLSLDALRRLGKGIRTFYRMVEGPEEGLTVAFFRDEPLLVGETGGVVLRMFLRLGEHVLYCVFGIIGSFERMDDKRYQLVSRDKRFHKRGVVAGDMEIDELEMTDLGASIECEMNANGVAQVVVVSDNWDACTSAL